MYYRKEDQVIREDYNKRDDPEPSSGDNGGKDKKFPTWLLVLIIIIVVLVAGFFLWKLTESTNSKKGVEQFGFRFY